METWCAERYVKAIHHEFLIRDDKWANQDELVDIPVDATTIDDDAPLLIAALNNDNFWRVVKSTGRYGRSPEGNVFSFAESSISNGLTTSQDGHSVLHSTPTIATPMINDNKANMRTISQNETVSELDSSVSNPTTSFSSNDMGVLINALFLRQPSLIGKFHRYIIGSRGLSLTPVMNAQNAPSIMASLPSPTARPVTTFSATQDVAMTEQNSRSGLQPTIGSHESVQAERAPSPTKAVFCAKSSHKKRKAEELLNTKPIRPLSAYNFYFRFERNRLLAFCAENGSDDVEAALDGNLPEKYNQHLHLTPENSAHFQKQLLCEQWDKDPSIKRAHRKEHGFLSFSNLSKRVAKNWSTLPETVKHVFCDISIRDHERFDREMEYLRRIKK